MGNVTSKTLATSCGVPQASVLGPILFIIHVNDLASSITNCQIIQYADETQFIHTGDIKDVQNLISRSEETLRDSVSLYSTLFIEIFIYFNPGFAFTLT